METVGLKVHIGWRTFHTSAERNHPDQHVLYINVPPPASFIWLVSWLPIFLCPWLRDALRVWFLPKTVVLKMRNPDKANDYDTERTTYQQALKPLRRGRSPLFFGTALVDGPGFKDVQGICMGMIPGRPLSDLHREDLSPETLAFLDNGEEPPHSENLLSCELSANILDTYSELTSVNIVHGDPYPGNFILRDDGTVVALDFEQAHAPGDVNNDTEYRSLLYQFRWLVNDLVRKEQRDRATEGFGRSIR